MVLSPFVISFVLIAWDFLRKRNKKQSISYTSSKSFSDKLWDAICECRACPKSGRWVERVIFGEEEKSNFCYRHPSKEIEMNYDFEEDSEFGDENSPHNDFQNDEQTQEHPTEFDRAIQKDLNDEESDVEAGSQGSSFIP